MDGHRYIDLCLGDTGAMTGHSPSAAVQQQVARGITLMLPSEDAVWVGEELRRRFGLPYWQFALTSFGFVAFARTTEESTQNLAPAATNRQGDITLSGSEEWFCIRCGRTSDQLVREDAQAEMELFGCKLPTEVVARIAFLEKCKGAGGGRFAPVTLQIRNDR